MASDSISEKIIERLEQFNADLERGDLSNYRITTIGDLLKKSLAKCESLEKALTELLDAEEYSNDRGKARANAERLLGRRE